MFTQPFFIHALSPVHVGTGHAADIIDLPLARQRATNIPYIPGSAIKGVLRAESRGRGVNGDTLFGPETISGPDEARAGALIAGDAWLLALPVRSFRHTFAWVTSPLLLTLARRDLPQLPNVGAPAANKALVSDAKLLHDQKLYLEDLDLSAQVDQQVAALAKWLAGQIWPNKQDVMASRLAVVDDEVMSFLMETATQLDTRIRLKEETRTVAKGALWVEESLPAETLLVGLLAVDGLRTNGGLTPQQALDQAVPDKPLIAQFGGKATVGRGRCELILA